MKICFYNVTASFIPGGLETYCWEVGRALARRGHDVTIVAGDRGGAWHNEAKLVQFPFRIEQDWPHFGTRFRRLMERLSFARHALAHLIGQRYDAVIINKPFDFPVMARARQRGMRAQTLFRSGGTDFFPGDRLFAGAIDHWASSSGYNARQVEARYRRPVEVIHNGVDVDVFKRQPRDAAARAAFGAGASDVLAVSVGRLVGWKGVRIAIDAIAAAPAHVRYVVVGSGPEEEHLKAQAASLGITERVRFAGRVAHDALPALLSQCDLFLQPSIGEEAFGISVVEAMACGLPVLASNNGGLPETVAAGETGELLPPGDTGAWSRAIAALAGDPARLQALGHNARTRAEAHFTWAENARRHEARLMERV